MVRTKQEQAVEFKCIRGGSGETEMRKILNGVEELYGKGRLFNHMVLAPGRTIGEHRHEGDNSRASPSAIWRRRVSPSA